MIVSTTGLFEHAYGQYAVGAYNINNAEQIMGLFRGNMDSEAPFILQISKGARTYTDKRLLEAMIYKFNGGPVGLSSLAVAVGEDASTLEDVHEPFLIMQGYISRTPRGRVAMPSAYLKMGAAPPANSQGWLL